MLNGVIDMYGIYGLRHRLFYQKESCDAEMRQQYLFLHRFPGSFISYFLCLNLIEYTRSLHNSFDSYISLLVYRSFYTMLVTKQHTEFECE